MTERLLQEVATIDIFERRAIQFQRENHLESRKLAENILEWASIVAEETYEYKTIGDILASQINFRVQEIKDSGHQITTEQYIEDLFCPNCRGEIDADIIMGRLQIG
jgi:hypothetical protein